MFRNPLIDALVVLLAVLFIFGPKRLPMLGRSLGHGMREFKDGITGKSGYDEADEQPALMEAAAAPVATTAAREPADASRS